MMTPHIVQTLLKLSKKNPFERISVPTSFTECPQLVAEGRGVGFTGYFAVDEVEDHKCVIEHISEWYGFGVDLYG